VQIGPVREGLLQGGSIPKGEAEPLFQGTEVRKHLHISRGPDEMPPGRPVGRLAPCGIRRTGRWLREAVAAGRAGGQAARPRGMVLSIRLDTVRSGWPAPVGSVQQNRDRSVVMDFHHHHGGEAPGGHGEASRAQVVAEALDKRSGQLGWGGAGEAGPPAGVSIGVQSELRYGERLPSYIEHRQIHLAGGVLKDAQVGDLRREKARVGLIVLGSGADKHNQAASDLADDLTVHRNGSVRDPLHNGAHVVHLPKEGARPGDRRPGLSRRLSVLTGFA
jgi:hypothetical protein